MNPADSFPFDLSDADQAALDALVESGFDVSGVPADLRQRAMKLSMVLGLLDRPVPGAAPGLADRIMGRIGVQASDRREATLSKRDADALQALADAGFDAGAVPAELAASAAKHGALASLVTAAPAGVKWSPDLVDRTMDLVYLVDESGPIPIERGLRGDGLSRRFWDVVAVAATFMLGASVVLPVLSTMHGRQINTACAGRLMEIKDALSAYAGDNQNSLPAATASLGGTYWDTGKDPKRSNSANLFTLARKGYAKLKSLTCPGHEQQVPECATSAVPESGMWDWPDISHVSYSYQVQSGPSRPHWNVGSLAILADRSPIILRAMRGEVITNPLENSPNHTGRGENVLFIDGSVRWLFSPVLAYEGRSPQGSFSSHDNIWLPWEVEQVLERARSGQPVTLNGNEVPSSPFDTFLAP